MTDLKTKLKTSAWNFAFQAKHYIGTKSWTTWTTNTASIILRNGNASREIRTALYTETGRLTIGVATTMTETSCGWSTSQMNENLQRNQTLDFKILPNLKTRIKLQNKENINLNYQRISRNPWCLICNFPTMMPINEFWLIPISRLTVKIWNRTPSTSSIFVKNNSLKNNTSKHQNFNMKWLRST